MANPTIGFIGYGNMAQAIAEGLINAGAVNGSDIVACAAHYDKLERNAAKLMANGRGSNVQARITGGIINIHLTVIIRNRSSPWALPQ